MVDVSSRSLYTRATGAVFLGTTTRDFAVVSRKLSVPAGFALAVVGLATAFTSTAASECDAYGPNNGAARGNSAGTTSIGAKADFNVISSTIPSGKAILHPLQVAGFTSDFVGWGVQKLNGINIGNDCPSNNSHWNVYIDYSYNDLYFCYAEYGYIGTSDNPTNFKISYGDCGGNNAWRVWLNGVRKDCDFEEDFTSDFARGAGSETINYATPPSDAGIHYDNAQKQKLSDSSWVNWTDAYNSDCAETGYRIRPISAYEFWAENYP